MNSSFTKKKKSPITVRILKNSILSQGGRDAGRPHEVTRSRIGKPAGFPFPSLHLCHVLLLLCRIIMCFQSPGGITAGPELPHFHITVLTLLRDELSVLVTTACLGEGLSHWPICLRMPPLASQLWLPCNCGSWGPTPMIRNASYGNRSQSGRHCTCLLLAPIQYIFQRNKHKILGKWIKCNIKYYFLGGSFVYSNYRAHLNK